MEIHSCMLNVGSSDIVFFDIETTVPNKPGLHFHILEFGAIIVCPKRLVELESFSILVRPKDLTMVPVRSTRSEGITRAVVANAPVFEDVADRIYEILNGKIWAGHNIRRFDCVRIKEAFQKIGRPVPEPVGIIDSLGILSEKFGKRAGNMKMATLATYFGLGQQKHRGLDDVRLNLEVLKHCATVLFLESSLPNALNWNPKSPSSSIMTRSRSNELRLGNPNSRKSPPPSLPCQRPVPYTTRSLRKMTESVKNMLCRAQEHPSLQSFIKRSHSLIR